MILKKLAFKIKNQIQLKINENYIKKNVSFIKNNDIILCKYWIKDKYKYRICWFGGICLNLKKKNHLSYLIIKNTIWNVRIINYFFLYSPSLLQIILKRTTKKYKKKLYYKEDVA